MLNVKELKRNITANTVINYLEDFTSYNDSAYFCDMFHEYADGNTSIHNNDIMEFIANNPWAMQEVIDEGLYNPTENYNIFEHGQAAEYMTIYNELEENDSDIITFCALDYYENIKGEDITEEAYDIIANIGRYDCDTLGELRDMVNDIIEEATEEAEQVAA